MKLGIVLAAAGIVIGTTGIASAAVLTDYTIVPPGNLFPPETLAIVTDSNQYRGDFAWGAYAAPGDAPFYLINGATTSNQRVFYWTANLTAGTAYSYDFEAVNNYDVAPPVLQLSDNGALVGSSVTIAPSGPYGTSFVGVVGPWEPYTLSFTPTTSGIATIALVDTNTAYSGNDFSIAAIPEASTWAMMALGFAGLGFAGYRGSRNKAAALA
jgi:hypothetical protein